MTTSGDEDAELAAALDAQFAAYAKEDFLGVGSSDPGRRAAYDAAVRDAAHQTLSSALPDWPDSCTADLARIFAPRPGALDLRKRAKTLEKESLAEEHARRVAERVTSMLQGKVAFACNNRNKDACILTIDSDAVQRRFFAFHRISLFSVPDFCYTHKIAERELLNAPLYGIADSCVACNHRRPATLKAFFAAGDCFELFHLLRDGSYVSRAGFRSIGLFDANGKSPHPGWKFDDWKADLSRNPHARAYDKASSWELPLLLRLRRHGDVCCAEPCKVYQVRST